MSVVLVGLVIVLTHDAMFSERLLVSLALFSATRGALTSPPHIVVILADDLGWADVGWNNPGLHTPTLDRMAREGVILNQSYVQPSCSPSRAAFMSGRYPYHLGLQVRFRTAFICFI